MHKWYLLVWCGDLLVPRSNFNPEPIIGTEREKLFKEECKERPVVRERGMLFA